MKNLFSLIIAFGLSWTSWAAEEGPKPGPEHRKLSVLTGEWKLNEIASDSPFGPASTNRFHTITRFVHNGFFVEEAGKPEAGVSAYAYTILHYYDAGAKTYRAFYYDSMGNSSLSKTTFDGQTLKGAWEQVVNGKTYQCKSESVMAADGKSFKYEWSFSEDGVQWKPIFKGTGKKVGDAPAR